PRSLHSFPTRRSSDLELAQADVQGAEVGQLVRAERTGLRGGFQGGQRFFVTRPQRVGSRLRSRRKRQGTQEPLVDEVATPLRRQDRKSTRLNSSHRTI